MTICLSVICAPAYAVTGVGEMGVNILPSILRLDKETALEMCQENADLPNCDIVIADNEKDTLRFLPTMANGDNVIIEFDSQLSGNEYPIRMLNFE